MTHLLVAPIHSLAVNLSRQTTANEREVLSIKVISFDCLSIHVFPFSLWALRAAAAATPEKRKSDAEANQKPYGIASRRLHGCFLLTARLRSAQRES